MNAAVLMTGKGGKVTITAVGHFDERAVHVHAGLLIGYMREIRGALFGDSNPLYDIPMLLGLYRSGDLKLDELVSRKYRLDQVNDAYQDMTDGKKAGAPSQPSSTENDRTIVDDLPGGEGPHAGYAEY